MRWVFLLLLMLNVFYYVWHQQEAPLRPKEVASLSLFKGARQNIRLLSEGADASSVNESAEAGSQCIYLGGDISRAVAQMIEQRLVSLDIQAQALDHADEASTASYWVKIAPESRRLVDDAVVSRLRQDFPQIKSKIMSCQSIATAE
ncbi:hypothetical protein N5D61_22030 [Pseudomonas sp. GD03842]|uniref:hypothetical protein n=1 Tax=unclassified Pseudomonas TaxID=196821 RepID=UPI000D36C313|nr:MULTISPECIES: hypothetical protein [unclassified Pseudomonas]MDH0749012.1 hypothetical protein [Pseudomonas sp. GD03842]RAU39839.1 hypothetical protein DBP26_025430 [Pseudomonas sp. RIT 409]RAU46638.1 hypothetical protein DBY65_025620 [Pseudomonas sp. RIT 412]